MHRNMTPFLAVVLSMLLLVLVFPACSILCAASDEGFGWKFVIMGDTQDLAAHAPDLFFNATEWIASQQDIVYVAHMGDVVDVRDNVTQWQTAYDAMHVLDGHVDWGVVPGNHDLEGLYENGTSMGGGENATMYNSFFGDCEHFDIVKDRFIFIYIRYDQLDYAEAVLQAYPKLYAIIVTHAYLGNSYDVDVNFQKTLAKYDNVIAVLSGHHTGAAFMRYYNGPGDIDSLILTDYQDFCNVTNALKECTVFQDRIDVETFEPMTNTYRNGSTGFVEKFSFRYGRDLRAGILNQGKLFAQTDLTKVDIKIADLTPDPGNEVVVAGGADNIVAVYSATGSQIASVHQEQPYSLEVIDMNNDGKLEIVCGGKDLIVYDGNLQPLEILISDRNDTRPVMVTVSDLDKDNIPELLAIDYYNNSLTRLRVWNGYSKVVDVWVEEYMPPERYLPRNVTEHEFVETILPNGTIHQEFVEVEKLETYNDTWPTRPTVADLNGDGENEVYVDVPCNDIVSFDDTYVYTGYYYTWGVDFFVEEDGDSQVEAYGSGTKALYCYAVSSLGTFYIGNAPLNRPEGELDAGNTDSETFGFTKSMPLSMVGYDLDGDGDSEILWNDRSCNIGIYDDGMITAINSGLANTTLYAGSLKGDGTTDILVVTDEAIYVYENFRPAYATKELQNINNEYWLDDQPNVVSANATVTEVTNRPAAWYNVDTKFTATVNVTQEEKVEVQIDLGCLGKPTGASVSEWSYNETANTVTWNATGANPTITLFWTEIAGREFPLVLPYLAVGITVGWLYVTVRVTKKKDDKISRKTIALGASIITVVFVLLLIVNFVI